MFDTGRMVRASQRRTHTSAAATAHSCGASSSAVLEQLHRTIGNRAVGRLLGYEQRSADESEPATRPSDAEVEQFTLTGAQPPLELESADRVRLASLNDASTVQTTSPDSGMQGTLTTSRSSGACS